MAWIYILCADIFEIGWLFLVKWADAHVAKTWGPVLATLVLAIPASLLLNAALKTLPTGTVYAAFVGIGAVGTAIVGILFFNESTSLPRMLSFALVVIGLVGLKYFGAPAP